MKGEIAHFDTPTIACEADSWSAWLGVNVDRMPIPFGRPGTADEMAGVIAFMLSDAAAFITSMMLWVDGGTEAAVRPDRF